MSATITLCIICLHRLQINSVTPNVIVTAQNLSSKSNIVIIDYTRVIMMQHYVCCRQLGLQGAHAPCASLLDLPMNHLRCKFVYLVALNNRKNYHTITVILQKLSKR